MPRSDQPVVTRPDLPCWRGDDLRYPAAMVAEMDVYNPLPLILAWALGIAFVIVTVILVALAWSTQAVRRNERVRRIESTDGA